MTINNPPEDGEERVKDHQQTPQQSSEYMIDLPSRFDRWEPLVEIIATLILALATLSIAWSGYQAARWGGVQSASYSQAGARRTESTRASTTAGQLTQIDVGIFTNWINAYADDNDRLRIFYEERFRDEFIPAFDAWVATDPLNNPDSPKSPFAMPEYRLESAEEADRLEMEAEELYALGSEANQTADEYILNTVFLASVLFLVGLASRVKSLPMRAIVIFIAIVIMVYCFYSLILLPIT